MPAAVNGTMQRYFTVLPEAVKEIDSIPVVRGTVACGDLSVSFSDTNADIVLASSALGAVPGRNALIRKKFEVFSSEYQSVIAAVSCGAGESTTDVLYPGYICIAENGRTIASAAPFGRGDKLVFADADIEALRYRRRCSGHAAVVPELCLATVPEAPDTEFAVIEAHPFLPGDEAARREFCAETLQIQSEALAHRIKCCHAQKMVLGISGGLDSTLALLVLRRVCELLDLPGSDILAVTMPGFGTTGRTKNNALNLAKLIGAEIREISIAQACLQHFADLGHDPECRNSVYENTQARERTQILMDIANGVNGLVIGTGDLSELALGWCTYNGDQMSMYSVNASVPKSIIKDLMEYEISNFPESADILRDVIATPVSPELLPAADGDTPGQKTEEILGAYELHDFFIWNFCGNGWGREKLAALAKKAFAGVYDEVEIERCLKLFMKRFFTQQFKRSAAPDGIQAGEFSFSPRGGLQMPSDSTMGLWE